METAKQAKWCYIGCSLLLMAIGAWIAWRPLASAEVICKVLGVLVFVCGCARILGYFSHDLYNLAFQFDLALGVFALLFGAVLFFRAGKIIAFLPAAIGAFVLIDGVFKLQTAADAKRFGLSDWWLILLGAALCAVLGVILIANPFGSAKVLMMLAGLSIAADGLQNLFNAFYTVKIMKRGKKE